MRDEVEVCVRIGAEDHLVGSLHRQPRRGVRGGRFPVRTGVAG